MSKFKRFIRKAYYPFAVWVITCILAPLLFVAIYEFFLEKNVLPNDSKELFSIWWLVIPISFALSLPGFVLFVIGYHFSHRSKLKLEWVKIILLAINLINITVTFASGGPETFWTVWFPLSFLIISSLSIAFLPILRDKKEIPS